MKLSWLIMTLYIIILFGFFALAMQGCVSVTVNTNESESSSSEENPKESSIDIGIGEFDDDPPE